MNKAEILKSLKSKFTLGCRNWFRLRLWEDFGTVENASIEAQIQMAEEILRTPNRGDIAWAHGGWIKLKDHLVERLSDRSPDVRTEAAAELVKGYGSHACSAVDTLLEQIANPDETLYDKRLAVWLLPRVGAKGEEIISLLLECFQSHTADSIEEGELRWTVAESIERMTKEAEVMIPLIRSCLHDLYWKVRLGGLYTLKNLAEKKPQVINGVEDLLDPLLADEIPEVRNLAGELRNGKS